MTLETIERIARLMHEEAKTFGLEWQERHGRELTGWQPWEGLSPASQDLYRHVARQVLRSLGR